MKVLSYKTPSAETTIVFGTLPDMLKKCCDPAKTLIVADRNVHGLYRHLFDSYQTVIIDADESRKNLATVNGLYSAFMDRKLDRSSEIAAFGGGVICDITGFTASTFMRGLPFSFIPTTLLAQADASIGGKNGVNLKGYKNIVGTMTQPRLVLCDADMLETLPRREIQNGLAEIIKHALIGNMCLFNSLEQRRDAVLSLDKHHIEEILLESLRVKTAIVGADEREAGPRRRLNFGHTFAHALEKSLRIPHGEAVSTGMAIAMQISVNRGLLTSADAKRATAVLTGYGLPVSIPNNHREIFEAVTRDKKCEGDFIHYVLLRGIGEACVEKIATAELREVFHGLC